MFEKNQQEAAYRALNLLLDNAAARSQLTPDELRYAKKARDFIGAMVNGDVIASIWTIEDVKSLQDEEDEFTEGERITDEEARQVLKLADENHDASMGINWDVLQANLDIVREEAKQKT